MKTTTQTTASKSDTATYRFSVASDAVDFRDACGLANLTARIAVAKGFATVTVKLATWMDRETANRLAGGAPCVDYRFAA